MNPKDYEILGLKPEASLDEIRKRYDLLARRSIHDESVDIDTITGAYDRIIAENTVDYFNPDAELLEKKGFNMKKFKNFIFQRKLLIGIIVWVIIGLLLIFYIFFNPDSGGYVPDIAPF